MINKFISPLMDKKSFKFIINNFYRKNIDSLSRYVSESHIKPLIFTRDDYIDNIKPEIAGYIHFKISGNFNVIKGGIHNNMSINDEL